jgi:ribosome-associated toxin RatA of RatAB toxin-antitoxin module
VKSSLTIDIAAPPDLVFNLARDVERWPRLLPHYVAAAAEPTRSDGRHVVRFVARRPLLPVLGLDLPVAWRSVTWSEPDERRLRFVHLGGATSGMDVAWRIEAASSGSRVTIEHDFRPRLAAWAGFVDRLFTRPIATRTLATFKALAESLAPDAAAARADTSAARDPANQRA